MWAKLQKTYHGKTAYQYLEGARVEEMPAGNYEIISPLWEGILGYNREWRTVVLTDVGQGAVVQLELSPWAQERIDALVEERDRRYDRETRAQANS